MFACNDVLQGPFGLPTRARPPNAVSKDLKHEGQPLAENAALSIEGLRASQPVMKHTAPVKLP